MSIADKIPYWIAILGMISGVLIAILFGINEDLFKDRIKDGLSRNEQIQTISDESERQGMLKAEAEKNWRYYQRFHFHATGIGSMSLALLVFLAFVQAPTAYKRTAGLATAVGGFLYPFVWLFAGIYGPEMGRSAAKEAFAPLGYMGGLFLIGCASILILSAAYSVEFIKPQQVRS